MKAIVTGGVKRIGGAPIVKRSAPLDSLDVLVFLIPCLQFIHIKLIGVLDGSDLLFLVAFLYLGFRGEIRIGTPIARIFMVLCSLWLASQIVTDVVRHSAFVDYARGWSDIGMTLVNVAVLCTLMYGRWRRIVLFGWGMVAGGLLAYIPLRNAPEAGAPWKDIFSNPVTMAVFLIASRKDCRGHWPITLSALIGIVNFVLGSRGQGGFCLGRSPIPSVGSLSAKEVRRTLQVEGSNGCVHCGFAPRRSTWYFLGLRICGPNRSSGRGCKGEI